MRLQARSGRVVKCAHTIALVNVGSMILAGAAWAAEDDPTLEEVIVTAQFRSMRLQDTPLAITAVTGSMLDARSQTGITAVSAQAPNVTMVQGGSIHGGATAQVYIRGIGQFDSNSAYEPGVGMYIDDVYYATTFGSAFQLLDLDRVEILRGPQGTLSGKNSIGGSVKLYSKKPSEDPEAFLEATVGSFSRTDFRGGTNLTLVDDRLYARISAMSQSRDGYFTRYDYSCATNNGANSARLGKECEIGTSGGKDVAGARGALRWIASDALEINLIADFTRDRSETPASALLSTPPFGGYSFLDGTPFDSRFIPDSRYTSYATFCGNGGGIVAGPAGSGLSITIPASQPYCVPSHNDFTDGGISGTIDWQIGGHLSLKSITAYREYSGGFGDDNDGSPFDYQTNYVELGHHQFSQELRLSGDALDNAINWTVGGYYFDGFSSIGGRTHFPAQALDFIPNDPVNSKNTSAFAHVEWNALDDLNFVFGVRYTDDEKDYLFSRTDPNTGQVPIALSAINGLSAEFQGTRWDYKAGLDYHFTPSIMSYAQWSTGFRGGGINPRPLFSNQSGTFDPEKLNSYEVGFKSTLFDDQLRLNVAAFRSQYEDIVIETSSPYFNTSLPVNNDPTSPAYNPIGGTFPSNVPINAGRAKVEGIEVEVFFEPVSGLTIDATASTLDFKYQELSAAAIASGLTLDSPHIYSPENKWSAGIQYVLPVGGSATLTPRFDINHQAAFYTRDSGLVQPFPTFNRVPAYTVSNAQIAWKSEKSNLEVVAAVTNVFDKYYLLNTYDLQFLNSTAVGQPAAPREWALTIKRRF